MRLLRLSVLLVSLALLTVLTACGAQSSADDLATELETVTSWAATAHMVGDAWINGTVPTAYAKQTLEAAQQSLQEEMDTLAQGSTVPSDRRTKLLETLQSLEQTVGQMATAVEQEDRAALTQQMQQLSTEEQTIGTLAKNAGA